MRTQPQKIISPHTNVTFHAITQYIFLFFFRQLMFKKSKKGKGRCYRTQNWSLTRINSHITYRAVGIGGAGGNPPTPDFGWIRSKTCYIRRPCPALPPPPIFKKPSDGSHITYIQLTYIVVIHYYICIFWQIKRIIHPDWDTKASKLHSVGIVVEFFAHCFDRKTNWSFNLRFSI